jgi:hypothetical protein
MVLPNTLAMDYPVGREAQEVPGDPVEAAHRAGPLEAVHKVVLAEVDHMVAMEGAAHGVEDRMARRTAVEAAEPLVGQVADHRTEAERSAVVVVAEKALVLKCVVAPAGVEHHRETGNLCPRNMVAMMGDFPQTGNREAPCAQVEGSEMSASQVRAQESHIGCAVTPYSIVKGGRVSESARMKQEEWSKMRVRMKVVLAVTGECCLRVRADRNTPSRMGSVPKADSDIAFGHRYLQCEVERTY